ncbi:MAG: trypsin-like peptidase domain-containing protein [Patescibacteria group bacterium]
MKRNLAVVFMMAAVFYTSNYFFQSKIQASATVETRNFNEIIREASQATVVIELKRTINDAVSYVSMGGGVFVREDGYILTNYHIVDGNEDNLAIHCLPQSEDYQSRYIGDLNIMRQYRRYDVKIISYDPIRDLALLKIDGSGFPTINFGDDPKVGDRVFAIGSPLGLRWTVTHGIISREFSILDFSEKSGGKHDYYIQTDAAINSGNSGGPLLNEKGELIGLNAALIAPIGLKINAGLNLAVPIGDIRVLLPRLFEEKTTPERSYLGIKFISPYQEAPKEFKDYAAEHNIIIPQERDGILITDVKKISPADQAGLRIGDIIKFIDGKKIISFVDLNQAAVLQKPGKIIRAEIQRRERTINLNIALEKKSDTDTD